MRNLLSTRDLIARMTPTALAEMIASLEQTRDDNLDAEELATLIALETELTNIVGEVDSAGMVAEAMG